MIFPLGTTKIEDLNLLDYVEDVAKANIGPMNVDQQEIKKKQPTTIGKLLGVGVSHSMPGQIWSIHSKSL